MQFQGSLGPIPEFENDDAPGLVDHLKKRLAATVSRLSPKAWLRSYKLRASDPDRAWQILVLGVIGVLLAVSGLMS